MKHVCLLSRLALAIVVICVQVNDVAAGKKKSKKEGIEQQEQDQKIKLVQVIIGGAMKRVESRRPLLAENDDLLEQCYEVAKCKLEAFKHRIKVFEGIIGLVSMLETAIPRASDVTIQTRDEATLKTLKNAIDAFEVAVFSDAKGKAWARRYEKIWKINFF